VIVPITITANAGASLSAPESASIGLKRKVPINKGKNKQRGSVKTTNVSTWDRLKDTFTKSLEAEVTVHNF